MATTLIHHAVIPVSEHEPDIDRNAANLLEEDIAEDIASTPTKKKKKKKPKKAKPPPVVIPPVPEVSQESKQSMLCISRNKHWKYISSYHVSRPHWYQCRDQHFTLGTVAPITYRAT